MEWGLLWAPPEMDPKDVYFTQFIDGFFSKFAASGGDSCL